jgi:predicted phage terminase large subunit-like protein
MRKSDGFLHSGPAVETVMEPQPGPQTEFLATSADIAIYGGSAGGGKTWALLYEVLRNIDVPDFGAVIFRKTFPMIMNQGALWDESTKIFPKTKAEPTKSSLMWTFPSGAKCAFRHMQHEDDKEDYQGSQIPYIAFDELTHFTKSQFMYMLSRNRSTCGVNPYMRGTCNPDANSWVKELLAPWLDHNFVQPEDAAYFEQCRKRAREKGVELSEDDIPKRKLNSGDIAYFSGVDGKFMWHTYEEYVYEMTLAPEERVIKTLTFIRASIYDNKILLKANPQYLASLKALPYLEQERLLKGNWDVVETGNMFKDKWFPIKQSFEMPRKFKRLILFYDLASTKPSEIKKRATDPDYTCGTTLGQGFESRYYILDQTLIRESPGMVFKHMGMTAERIRLEWGDNLELWVEQEPGSSGVIAVYSINEYMMKNFNFRVRGLPSSGSKVARARAISKDAQDGNVWMLDDVYGRREYHNAHWNSQFLAMATAFPDPEGVVHDDPVDSLSGAHNACNQPPETYTYSPRCMGVSSQWASN